MSEKYTYHRKYIDADGNYQVIETRIADNRKRVIGEDNQPFLAWLAAGGEFDPANDKPYVEPTPRPTPQEIALARNRFPKQQVRRAFRALGIESTLDTILDTPVTVNEIVVTPRNDWNDANEVLMDDPVLVAVLAVAEINVDTVKLQIAGLKSND